MDKLPKLTNYFNSETRYNENFQNSNMKSVNLLKYKEGISKKVSLKDEDIFVMNKIKVPLKKEVKHLKQLSMDERKLVKNDCLIFS